MKRVTIAAGLWIAVFVITYIAMILVNSMGAAAHGQSPSYGSSRIYQEISTFAHLLVHLLPAVAVGYFAPSIAWQVSAPLSFILELSGNLSLFGREGFPYIGDPFAMILTYVLVAALSAYWMGSVRPVRAT